MAVKITLEHRLAGRDLPLSRRHGRLFPKSQIKKLGLEFVTRHSLFHKFDGKDFVELITERGRGKFRVVVVPIKRP